MMTKREIKVIECDDTVAYWYARDALMMVDESKDCVDLLHSMIWLKRNVPEEQQIWNGFFWWPELTADLLKWERSKVTDVLEKVARIQIKAMITAPGCELETTEGPIVHLSVLHKSKYGVLKSAYCHIHPMVNFSVSHLGHYPEIEKRFGGGND